MTAALLSALTQRLVNKDVAMTGEVTLNGLVLPVGGIKEKVLAARRGGLQTVLLPRKNENDLEKIPEELRQDMNFILVDTIDDVLRVALSADGPEPSAEK